MTSLNDQSYHGQCRQPPRIVPQFRRSGRYAQPDVVPQFVHL